MSYVSWKPKQPQIPRSFLGLNVCYVGIPHYQRKTIISFVHIQKILLLSFAGLLTYWDIFFLGGLLIGEVRLHK